MAAHRRVAYVPVEAIWAAASWGGRRCRLRDGPDRLLCCFVDCAEGPALRSPSALHHRQDTAQRLTRRHRCQVPGVGVDRTFGQLRAPKGRKLAMADTAYGLWSLAVLNTALFGIFAISFTALLSSIWLPHPQPGLPGQPGHRLGSQTGPTPCPCSSARRRRWWWWWWPNWRRGAHDE